MTRRSFAIASAMTGAGFALGLGLGRVWTGSEVPGGEGGLLEIARLTGSGNVIGAAISPDGNFVAYVQMDQGLQSLWLRQVASGQTLRIISEGEQFFWGHTFSRDGNDIVFGLKTPGDNAGGIYAVSALGGPKRRIIDGVDSTPAISPDGKWLAFARAAYPSAEESSLMVAAVDGSQERALAVFTLPEMVAPNFYSGPAWAPDGSSVAASVSRRSAGTFETRAWIASVELQNGAVSVLSDPDWVRAAQVGYLPDGSGLLAIARLYNQQTTQIWHVDAASGEVSPITNDLSDHRMISLSGDGDALVSIVGDLASAIWTGPLDGSEPPQRKSLTKFDGYRGVSYLPDGRLVHSSNEGGVWGLWTMTPDGSERAPLLAVEPDEDLFGMATTGSGDVYFRIRTRTGQEIRVLESGSSVARIAVSGVSNDAFDVSGDGTLVYGADVDGQHRLYRLSPDGSEPVQITELDAMVPTIDPSGERIAFYFTDAMDRHRLGVMTVADGEMVWSVDAAVPGFYTQLCLREEGLYLTSMPGDRANVWLIPLDGGESRQLTDFDDQRIWDLAISDDGQTLAVARGRRDRDAVLIKGFKGAATGRST